VLRGVHNRLRNPESAIAQIKSNEDFARIYADIQGNTTSADQAKHPSSKPCIAGTESEKIAENGHKEMREGETKLENLLLSVERLEIDTLQSARTNLQISELSHRHATWVFYCLYLIGWLVACLRSFMARPKKGMLPSELNNGEIG
jgi:hypothetical protein